MKRKIIFLLIFIYVFVFLLKGEQLYTYKSPPEDVREILSAKPFPRFVISPDGTKSLLVDYDPMLDIRYLSQPMLKLAGIRILPLNNSRQHTVFYTGLTIVDLKTGKKKKIRLPEGIKMSFPKWSWNSKWVAFLRYLNDAVELWVVEAKNGIARRIAPIRINTTLSNGFIWMPDSRGLLVTAVPEDRGEPPKRPSIPEGPIAYETSGKVAKVRTYQDLLRDRYDELFFDYYCTSQIMFVNLKDGKVEKIGPQGIYLTPSPSPDGKYILVHSIKKPYSYSVPYYYFARSIEVWNRKGEVVYKIELPLYEEIPIGGVPIGPREVRWRPFEDAELIWVEALDGGDPKKEVAYRDRLVVFSAPFKGKPKEILKLKRRFRDLDFIEGGKEVLITEYEWKRRWKTILYASLDRKTKVKLLFDLSARDRYNDPGEPVVSVTQRGEVYVLRDGDWIFMAGEGSTPKGDFPFLRRFNLKSGQVEEIFRSRDKCYESFVGFAFNSLSKIIIRHESNTEPPNYWLIDKAKQDTIYLTEFEDPFPELRKVRKMIITYMREDSVLLSGTLYLPANYKEGQKLPAVIWAYPREYNDPGTAGQVRGSEYKFLTLRGASHLFFVTQGYAVLDHAQMPVIGDPETMNDTFVEQIVASAKAAIDKLNSMGIIDVDRVGIAGHSYGAFMVANLLAHSDLFSAGIARSGAYNRTLTPFGFQNERRTLWEAPEVYFKVSPFMYADKVNEPILLIHGEDDNNSGTFPLQSKRFYHALKGHGATARLVLLPMESHGYKARESIEHVLAEMIEWFDKYVKNKK